MLGLMFVLGICTVLIFNILVNSGAIYPANYAERKINEAYDVIQKADEVTEDIIPPLCRYVIFNADGEVFGGNMTEDSVKIAWNVANHGTASGDYFYKVIPRSDEYVVLQYSLTPQYQSAFLREHFIPPQNLMTIIVVLRVEDEGGVTGTVNFKSGVEATFTLRHGQKLVFENLPAGTRYNVTEVGVEDRYIPSVVVKENGVERANQTGGDAIDLSTGSALVGEYGENSVVFTNTFQDTPVTGLFMDNLPFILLGAVAVLAFAMLTVLKRKRIQN